MIDFPTRVAGWLGGLLFVAAALGAGGLYVYDKGKTVERAAWVARTAQAARDASEAARRVEQERFRAKEITDENHRAELERARRTAAAARTELDRLRVALAERERTAARDAAAAGRPDGTAAERELLGDCAAAYQDVAGAADRLAGQVRGLQGYVRDVVRPE